VDEELARLRQEEESFRNTVRAVNERRKETGEKPYVPGNLDEDEDDLNEDEVDDR
jgi:hypothetical protein